MCGIYACMLQNGQGAQTVYEGLKRLEYRGYDSWGIGVVDSSNKSGQLLINKTVGKISQSPLAHHPHASLAIGHTRWATHGSVTRRNSHPHLDCSSNLAIVHNGIIENYTKLKASLIKAGHRFKSETDSEVIAHLIEKYLKHHSFIDSVRLCSKKLTGHNAFIVINTNPPEIVAVRSGSPLILGVGNNKQYIISSDIASLAGQVKRVIIMADGDIAHLTSGYLVITDVSGQKVTRRQQPIGLKMTETQKNGYRHYMLKEINEQPAMLYALSNQPDIQLKKLANKIKSSNKTWLVGCGTAAYMSMAGSYLLAEIAGIHIQSIIGSQFSHWQRFLDKDSLVIALSQSGETLDTLEAVRLSQFKKTTVGAMINSPRSSLENLANITVPLKAGPEIAVASTKASISKLAHLVNLSYILAGQPQKGTQQIRVAAKATNDLMERQYQSQIRAIAQKLKNSSHLYIIGRGVFYPAALEAALKIKEVSYIHAEGFAAGELKHGVIALIEKQTPCLLYLPNDSLYADNLSAALELKARGAMIIGISHQDHEVFDKYLHLPDCKETTIIPGIVIAQLLAYHLAIAKKLNPDMPRNLAKSVTVK
jgi:glutamine---fructose-6-phosphate transaminase (isomerizing)